MFAPACLSTTQGLKKPRQFNRLKENQRVLVHPLRQPAYTRPMNETYPPTEQASPLRVLIGRANSLILGMIVLARAALAGFGAAPAPRAAARLILRRFVLPAEAALRRAILMLAATLPPVILRPRMARAGKGAPPPPRPGAAVSRPVFCLTEPRPRVRLPQAPLPRIRFLDVAPPPSKAADPQAEDAAFAERLARRLLALEAAFENPQGEARRLLRRRAAEAAKGAPARARLSFFRIPGDTPGLHDTSRSILKELNQIASTVHLPVPDSS